MSQFFSARTLQDIRALQRLGGSVPYNPLALVANTQGVDATTYGLYPNTGKDITALLQTCLTAARVANLPLFLRAGDYLYSDSIDYAGGGLVCPNGIARFIATDVSFNNHVINFNHPTAGVFLNGVEVRNVRFTCSSRPDSGLTNDAPEQAHFMRFTKVLKAQIGDCQFTHNYGGAVLLRDVQGGIISRCKVEDVWKDAFHTTDDSFLIVRVDNEVYGGGDDAFATVGVIAKGSKPRQVFDLNNRVYGVRRARGFAYVGVDEAVNDNCSVQGRIPSYIPQKVGPTGERYNTACALYIASETGFYGSSNIEVTNFEGDGCAPGIWDTGATGGTPGQASSTLQQIHLSAVSAASPLRNIKVRATMKNGGSRGFFADCNNFATGLDVVVTVDDNRDPYGLLSLTGTPFTAQTNGAEVQQTRDVSIKGHFNNIARGAVFLDADVAGECCVDIKVGYLNQTGATAQSAITLAVNTKLTGIDLALHYTQPPTAVLPGLQNRLIDNPNVGVTRSTRITGVDCSPAAANILAGYPTRAVSVNTTTGNSVLNTTGRPLLVHVRGGAVTSIARANVRGRVTATGTTGTTFTCLGDVTDIYPNAAVVTFFDSKGVSLGTSAVSASAVASGVTTVTVAAVPGTFLTGMQAAVVATPRTIPTNGTNQVGRVATTAISATTFTCAGNQTATFTNGSTATFFDVYGNSIGTSVVSASAFGTDTVVTVAAVPAAFVSGAQVAVFGAITSRTNGYFELFPETAIVITSTTAPTAQVVEPSF